MRYYARRITFYVVTFWAAVSLNFLLPRAIPGDPKQIYLDTMLRKNGELTPGLIQSVDVLFGSDDATLWEQYLAYWKNIFTGDLGTSVLYVPAPVSQLLGEALPW
ncbi:MAG: ABC transporter permease, partial [Cellulosimicrobium funkei]